MSVPRTPEQANRLKWTKGRRGHYEVYYLTFNHLKSRSGFWIRYTMTAPVQGGPEPWAQIWFSYFNYPEPEKNFGLTAKYPISALHAEHSDFQLLIGHNGLSDGRAAGRIQGLGRTVEWDFRFIPSETVHLHLPRMLYRVHLADTLALCPHLDVYLNGRVTIDGQTFELKNDPGNQTHLWGEKHAERWAWVHCNAFAEDRTATLEGLSVQIKRLGVPLPPFNFLFLRYRGKDYRFTELHHLACTGGKFEPGLWQLRAQAGNTLFKGEISARFQDMVCAEYADPDGDPAWCHNTEVGHSAIRVYRRPHPLASWRHEDTLTSLATTHVEFAGRKRDPRVTRSIEVIPS